MLKEQEYYTILNTYFIEKNVKICVFHIMMSNLIKF